MGEEMKKIIEEYGQIILATVGALAFLIIFNVVFVKTNSPFLKFLYFFVKRGM